MRWPQQAGPMAAERRRKQHTRSWRCACSMKLQPRALPATHLTPWWHSTTVGFPMSRSSAIVSDQLRFWGWGPPAACGRWREGPVLSDVPGPTPCPLSLIPCLLSLAGSPSNNGFGQHVQLPPP